VDLPEPVPPTMATTWPGSAVKLMWDRTSSPVPVRLYLNDTSRNSTFPVVTCGAARSPVATAGTWSTMSTSVSSTSSTRRPLAWARALITKTMEIIITLKRI